MPRSVRIILLALSVILGLLFLRSQYARGIHWENHPVNFGTRDFIAYWAGYQAWSRGLNPYDVDTIYSIEREALPTFENPQAFLNPPWLFPLLAPVLSLPFSVARFVWLGCNGLFALLLLMASRKVFGGDVPLRRIILWSAPFLPLLIVFWMGQLSLLVGASLLLAVLCFDRRWDVVAGVLLFISTLKPQLVFLVLFVLALRIFRERRMRVIAGFLSAMAISLAAVIVVDRDGIGQWVSMKFAPLDQRSATITTFVREALMSNIGEVPRWPIVIVPLIGLLITGALYARSKDVFGWQNALPPLLCSSLIVTPYAWPYDFSILLVVHAAIVIRAHEISDEHRKRTLLVGLLAIQALFILVAGLSRNMEHAMWFPFLLLAMWYWSKERRGDIIAGRAKTLL